MKSQIKFLSLATILFVLFSNLNLRAQEDSSADQQKDQQEDGWVNYSKDISKASLWFQYGMPPNLKTLSATWGIVLKIEIDGDNHYKTTYPTTKHNDPWAWPTSATSTNKDSSPTGMFMVFSSKELIPEAGGASALESYVGVGRSSYADSQEQSKSGPLHAFMFRASEKGDMPCSIKQSGTVQIVPGPGWKTDGKPGDTNLKGVLNASGISSSGGDISCRHPMYELERRGGEIVMSHIAPTELLCYDHKDSHYTLYSRVVMTDEARSSLASCFLTAHDRAMQGAK